MSGVDKLAAQGPTEVGTRLAFTSRGKARESEIVAVDPGRSVTLRSVQGGVSADYTYAMESFGEESTMLTLVADCQTRGLWNLLGPVLRPMLKRADGGQLNDFKATVESLPLPEAPAIVEAVRPAPGVQVAEGQ